MRIICLFVFPLTALQAFAFTPIASRAGYSSSLLSTVVESDVEVNSQATLEPDRYITMHRFSVQENCQAKFEKRWATRKSRLSASEGFKYFHLMRRVTLNDDGTTTYDGGESDDSAFGNYVSFTVWDKKSSFSAWRKGEAFKEAHGGTSIGAVFSTMMSSALVLRGLPRPMFYYGLLQQSMVPETTPQLVDSWRDVQADGINTLPAECFVACNQFFIPSENAPAFEKQWADRESKLKECDGFISFGMLRRDGRAKEYGIAPMDSAREPTHLSTTIWRDRSAFDDWRNGQAFRQAHGSGEKKGKDGETQKAPVAPLWTRPPKPVFYEATLVISTSDGV